MLTTAPQSANASPMAASSMLHARFSHVHLGGARGKVPGAGASEGGFCFSPFADLITMGASSSPSSPEAGASRSESRLDFFASVAAAAGASSSASRSRFSFFSFFSSSPSSSSPSSHPSSCEVVARVAFVVGGVVRGGGATAVCRTRAILNFKSWAHAFLKPNSDFSTPASVRKIARGRSFRDFGRSCDFFGQDWPPYDFRRWRKSASPEDASTYG